MMAKVRLRAISWEMVDDMGLAGAGLGGDAPRRNGRPRAWFDAAALRDLVVLRRANEVRLHAVRLLDGLRRHAVFLGEAEQRLAFFDLVPHVIRSGFDDVSLEQKIVGPPSGLLRDGVVETNVEVRRVPLGVADDGRQGV